MTKNKELIYLALISIAVITFYPLLFTGFATADDFHFYLVARRGQVLAESSLFAEVAGRFYFYLVKPVYSLPYLFDNMAVVKAFQYVPLIMCFLLFAKIVFLVTKSKEMACFYLLLFLVTMQISKHTSLFVSYPFYFTFSFFLLLLSIYYLIRFYQRNKKKLLFFSAFLFGVGLMFYETYILFLLFVFIVVIANNFQKEIRITEKIKHIILQFLPFLLIGIFYLTAYFVFRIYHPSQYPGTSFGSIKISFSSFLYFLWRLSYSSFPLTVYETSHYIFWDKSDLVTGYSPVVLNLILSARVEWIVKGILVAYLGYKLLISLPPVKIKKLLVGLAISVLIIFMPHIPLAMTVKYRNYVENGDMIGYVTTFFSFFGTLFFLALLFSYFINLLNFSLIIKKIITVIIVFGFFICSVLTDFSNYSIAKDIRSANLRLYAVDELLKTEEFKSIPAGSPFYAKDLWENPSYCARSLTEQEFNWYEYFEAKNGITYPVGRDAGYFLDYSKKVQLSPYFLTIRQAEKSEDFLLIMAQMAPLQQKDSVVNHYADKTLMEYYSKYKIFTVSFRIKGDPALQNIPLQINHIHDTISNERTIEINICNTKKGNAATIFTIQSAGIDLTSIQVSNMINRKNKYFYL
ncbi:MAG: hypothetical protein M0Q38_04740 [Bacteroidales bacterium]|nr:hypothetical protein [Bacteroidales bacterium]